MADLSKMYTDQYDHSFNPAEYKRDATRLGGLSKHVKGILRVESDDRSEADVRAVDVSSDSYWVIWTHGTEESTAMI